MSKFAIKGLVVPLIPNPNPTPPNNAVLANMDSSDIQYRLIHPAVKQSSLHSPSSSLTGGIAASHNIIGEDGSVLRHNVKEVDPAHFNRLADVVVGCRREEMER